MSFALNPFISFGAGGGGGGGGGSCECSTVGSGADYETLSAALLAGSRNINVITDVTELTTIPINGATIINIVEGSVLNLGSNTLNWAGDYGLEINGNGSLLYNTSSGVLFNANGNTNAKLTVENINIQNNSSGNVCITDIDYARFHNVIFDSDLFICSDFNVYSDGIYRNGNIVFNTTGQHNNVVGGIFENVIVVNSGVNCLTHSIVNNIS